MIDWSAWFKEYWLGVLIIGGFIIFLVWHYFKTKPKKVKKEEECEEFKPPFPEETKASPKISEASPPQLAGRARNELKRIDMEAKEVKLNNRKLDEYYSVEKDRLMKQERNLRLRFDIWHNYYIGLTKLIEQQKDMEQRLKGQKR